MIEVLFRPTRADTQLDMLLMNKVELVVNNITNGHSNHEIVELKVLRRKMNESTRVETLDFMTADSGFMDLVC